MRLMRRVLSNGCPSLDAIFVGAADNGASLGAKDAIAGPAWSVLNMILLRAFFLLLLLLLLLLFRGVSAARGEKLREARDVFHELNTVLLGLQTLVDLEKRDNILLLPEVGGGGDSFDTAVQYRVFEEDGADDAVAREGSACDDSRPHVVDETVHVLRISAYVGDAVSTERSRGGPTALVKGSDEAMSRSYASAL